MDGRQEHGDSVFSVSVLMPQHGETLSMINHNNVKSDRDVFTCSHIPHFLYLVNINLSTGSKLDATFVLFTKGSRGK